MKVTLYRTFFGGLLLGCPFLLGRDVKKEGIKKITKFAHEVSA
jgi:hypothetical protein